MFEDRILFWISASVVLVLLGLGSVAFLTLMERKVLSLSQNRMGPTKTSFSGVLQPLADGLKLFLKKFQALSGPLPLLSGPVLMFMMFLAIWSSLYWKGVLMNIKMSGFAILILLSALSYSVIISGWVSMSTFSKLGMSRSILQSLAYEISLVSIWMALFVTQNSASVKPEQYSFNLVICVLWVFMLMLDCNRAPFDLLEGESELISGYNTEMSSIPFILLFLGEYGMILCFSVILASAFLDWAMLSSLAVIVVLLSRSSFPRIRYDSLMGFTWMTLLPCSLLTLFFCFLVSSYR